MLQPALRFIEHSINSLLEFDPSTLEAIALMRGKVIAVEIKGPDLRLHILPHDAGVFLRTEYEGDPHVLIRGTPYGLMRLAAERERQRATFSGDVEILGDLALSQHLQQIVRRLDIDWEEMLSRVTGDVVAHQVGNMVRGMARWGRTTARTLEQNLAEYVKYEIELVPVRYQIDEFIHEVDIIRSDVERLELKIQRLKSRLGQQ